MVAFRVIGTPTPRAEGVEKVSGEALYADLGHFGRKPIQAGWLYFVLPSLLINYFGQGALVLSNPAANGTCQNFQMYTRIFSILCLLTCQKKLQMTCINFVVTVLKCLIYVMM